MKSDRLISLLFLISAFAIHATQAAGSPGSDCSANVLHVYGPGGPLPAMKEAAATFSKMRCVQVVISAGPIDKWAKDAQLNADLIFSGSEEMMSDFQRALRGSIDPATIRPLYLRKAAILVRPGNPMRISGLEDLLKPGHHILVVQGAGQLSLWEDVVGRKGDINSVARFRTNIATVAANSADARTDWIGNKSLDAWLIWNIWQVANPSLAEIVPIDQDHQIYRDCAIALTSQGEKRSEAGAFVDFLQSPQGEEIFVKWGWNANTPSR
jgi:accessory colonization factor AcfC